MAQGVCEQGKVKTVSYRSEHEYEAIREELMAINDKYNINREVSAGSLDFNSMPLKIRTRRRHLRHLYEEMSRQRFIMTVPPVDRRKLVKLVNRAHLVHYTDVGDMPQDHGPPAKLLDN